MLLTKQTLRDKDVVDRIAIARALAARPKLIVCDGPTSALDVSVQVQILDLLEELQRELGAACLFITHDIGVVDCIADRVAVMRAGRVVEQGASEPALQQSRHEYTRTLLAAVPRVARQASLLQGPGLNDSGCWQRCRG